MEMSIRPNIIPSMIPSVFEPDSDSVFYSETSEFLVTPYKFPFKSEPT